MLLLLETGGDSLGMSSYVRWFQAASMALYGGLLGDHLLVCGHLGNCNNNNASTYSIF